MGTKIKKKEEIKRESRRGKINVEAKEKEKGKK